jgi:hypothetical protein
MSKTEISDFDVVLKTIPDFIMKCPVFCQWVEFKGETYFAGLNYERSIKAGRPMIDLSYCATRYMNANYLKTVQYSEKHFKPSKLNENK